MDTIERITPERVAAAYEKCGMNPIQHGFYRRNMEGCCGLSAIAIAEYGVSTERLFGLIAYSEAQWLFDLLGLRRSYAIGFTHGYDGEEKAHLPRGGSEKLYNLGQIDGRAAAIRVGLCTPEGDKSIDA